LEKYLNGVGSVYEEVDPENIDDIPSGSRIAYITKDNKWRSAGWLSRVEMSYEDADGKPFKKPKKYVLYKSYNNACFPVQVEDVETFYVMTAKLPDLVVTKMITFKKPTKKTNFPVKIDDADGIEVVVYYARDEFNRKKFMASNKYKMAKEDPEGWEFEEDGSQDPDIRD
jgi:hypothetical protein